LVTAVTLTQTSDFIVEYLHEFEAIVKKALPVYQWLDEKKQRYAGFLRGVIILV
jgi:hypothetical protein